MKRVLIFLLLLIGAFLVYGYFCPKAFEPIHYFIPLANSFLHGHIDIPDNPGVLSELVPVNGKFYVVYPPAPAVLAIPFVLLFGPDVNQVWVEVFYAALTIPIFYFLTREFFKEKWIQILLTIALGLGTNFFYTALNGTSHFFSHIAVVLFLSLSLYFAKKKSPWLTGFFFAGAVLTRLPVVLTFPAVFYILYLSSDKSRKIQNFVYLCLPIVIGIIVYGIYNWARFGSITQTGYSLIPGVLDESIYSNGIFSLSYLGRNLHLMLAALPKLSFTYPHFLPSQEGMAIWLTTPALLLLFWTRSKDKTVPILLISCLLTAIPSLLHGCGGASQFGMRFSLDYLVLLILALGFAFQRIKPYVAYVFVALSVLINLWAVIAHYVLGLF